MGILVAPSPIIALPRANAVKEDLLDLRLFRQGVAAPAELVAVELVAKGGNIYAFTGLPESRGASMAISWALDGDSGVFEWGLTGTPPFVILPVRESGRDAESLGLRLFRNGIEVTGLTWSVQELGPVGDYAVSGYALANDGAIYVITYTVAGLALERSWTANPVPATTTAAAGIDYAELATQAAEALAEFGALAEIKQPIQGTYSTTTLSASLTPVSVGFCPVLQDKNKTMPINGVLTVVQKYLVAATGVSEGLAPGWVINWSGRELVITQPVETLAPAGVPVLYTVYMEA